MDLKRPIEDQSPVRNGPVLGRPPFSASRVPGAQEPPSAFQDISQGVEVATRMTDAETFHMRELQSVDRDSGNREEIFRKAANMHASPLDPTRRQWKQGVISDFMSYTGDKKSTEEDWFGTITASKKIMKANEGLMRMRLNDDVRENGPVCDDDESCATYVSDVIDLCPKSEEGDADTKDCRVALPHSSGDPALMKEIRDFATDACDLDCQQAITKHVSGL